MHFTSVEARRLLESTEADDVSLEKHSINDQRRPFLGVEVGVGKLKEVFTHTRLSTRHGTLRRRVQGRTGGDCEPEFTCSRECEQVIQSISDDANHKPGEPHGVSGGAV